MIIRNIIFAALVFMAAVSVLGCTSAGMFSSVNATEVQLQRANFKVVARDVTGEAEAGYLFGSSFSIGMTSNTFAVVRVSGTGMLYKEAIENLWKNFETAHGPVEGKRLALVNVRYDSEALNLVVYTQPKITIRADVVEFTD